MFKQLQVKTKTDGPNTDVGVQNFVLEQVARTRAVIPHRPTWGTGPRLDYSAFIIRNCGAHVHQAPSSCAP